MRIQSQSIFTHFFFNVHKTQRVVQTFVGKINEIHYYWFGWSLSHAVLSHFIRFTQKIKDNRIFSMRVFGIYPIISEKAFLQTFVYVLVYF